MRFFTAEITRNPFAFFALLSAFFALLWRSTGFSVAEIAESGAKNARKAPIGMRSFSSYIKQSIGEANITV